MSNSARYAPGPASAEVRKEGEAWTIILVRDLHHPPDKVWQALTDPKHLREWAPYDSDENLGKAGSTVKLTTFGAPSPHETETIITKAEAPRLLEFNWGGGELRWELEPRDGGTRLTLSAQIAPNWVSMGAAGWHICLDVLGHLLDGAPIGRISGMEAMKFDGWQRLNAEYAQKFGVELPNWGG